MPNSLTGVVRGNTIQFQAGLDLPDGQVVQVVLHPVSGARPGTNDQLTETFSRLAEE